MNKAKTETISIDGANDKKFGMLCDSKEERKKRKNLAMIVKKNEQSVDVETKKKEFTKHKSDAGF